MIKDPYIFIEDMQASIDAIHGYIRKMQKPEFMNSDMVQDAVIRRLEIIGEAANRLSDQFRQQHQEIPWAQIIGMRNFLIHDYGRVNLDLVWETINVDLPELASKLKKL